MKKIIAFLIIFCGFASFACAANFTSVNPGPMSCPMASATSSGNFCASFKVAASCRCQLQGLPPAKCNNMKALYEYLVAYFKTQDAMCSYQKDTSKQECMDDWDCVISGGDHGGLCNSTGNACV
jgi:hypothetical protein